MDAFTGKECICFNAKVLDEHVAIAVDVLSDLVLNPNFDAKDIVREKGVILEEIKMDEDNPDYLVHELFTQNFWKDQPLGKPILGTKETVRDFDQERVISFYQARFSPANLVISAAGNLDHVHFVELVKSRFNELKPVDHSFQGPKPAIYPRMVTRNKRSLEQVQICLGTPAPHIAHEKRYVAYVLSTLLGGGMSSRLFQKIREEQGLAYSIYSDLNPYVDTGCLLVYAGTSRESAPKVVQSILQELRDLKDNRITEDELRRVKDQLKGSMMLSLESSSSRMSNLARQEIYFDRFFSLDEMVMRVEEVTPDDFSSLANELFRSESVGVTVLGNLDGMLFPEEVTQVLAS